MKYTEDNIIGVKFLNSGNEYEIFSYGDELIKVGGNGIGIVTYSKSEAIRLLNEGIYWKPKSINYEIY